LSITVKNSWHARGVRVIRRLGDVMRSIPGELCLEMAQVLPRDDVIRAPPPLTDGRRGEQSGPAPDP
jgi:hypothetical protein